MDKVTDLPTHRLIKRLVKSKAAAEQLLAITSQAENKLKGLNDQLKKNVDAQRILNKHLAERNKARRPKATVLQFPK